MTATCYFHPASTNATWCCTHGLLRQPLMTQQTVVEPWETCNSQLIEQRIHLHYLFFCQPLFSLMSGLQSFHFCTLHFPTSFTTTAPATATTTTTTAPTTTLSQGAYHLHQPHPGGNLVHKHKSVKFDVVGEQPATKFYPAEQIAKRRRIALPQITDHVF